MTLKIDGVAIRIHVAMTLMLFSSTRNFNFYLLHAVHVTFSGLRAKAGVPIHCFSCTDSVDRVSVVLFKAVIRREFLTYKSAHMAISQPKSDSMMEQ